MNTIIFEQASNKKIIKKIKILENNKTIFTLTKNPKVQN